MTLLPVHILGGLTAIVTGFIALFTLKGGTPHRKSGLFFVYAMLVMSLSGVVLAIIKGNGGNIMGGGLAAYFTLSALLTVRRPAAGTDWKDWACAGLGLLVVASAATFGTQAVLSPHGTRFGYPAPLYFTFGGIAFLSVLGDVRMLRAGGIQGTRRLVRHLWRMSLALQIATASFFLGQAKVMPDWIRHNAGLRSIPVWIVFAALAYWLIRVRIRARPLRPGGVVTAGAPWQ